MNNSIAVHSQTDLINIYNNECNNYSESVNNRQYNIDKRNSDNIFNIKHNSLGHNNSDNRYCICNNILLKYIGVSPSGKASDSDSDIPVFESQYPSQ